MNQSIPGKTKQEIEETFVPINFNYIVTLPDGRQLSASTSFYPSPGSNPNSLLDQISVSLERQRAKHEITEFDNEIALHEESISKGDADLKALNEKHDADVAKLEEEFGEQKKTYTETFNKLKSEVEGGRRQKEFNPDNPGNKAKLQPYLTRCDEIKAKVEKMKEERDAGIKNHEKNMDHFREQISKLKKKREVREKLVAV